MTTTGGVLAEGPALNLSGKPRRLRATTPRMRDSMPIHMGIMCQRCGNVHFIATSSAIQCGRQRGIYQLNCPSPCYGTREFGREDMSPYRVADALLEEAMRWSASMTPCHAPREQVRVISVRTPEPPSIQLRDNGYGVEFLPKAGAIRVSAL